MMTDIAFLKESLYHTFREIHLLQIRMIALLIRRGEYEEAHNLMSLFDGSGDDLRVMLQEKEWESFMESKSENSYGGLPGSHSNAQDRRERAVYETGEVRGCNG